MNEKHIEEGLNHKNLEVTAVKYLSDYNKHRYKLVDERKRQPNSTFIEKKLTTKVIVDCKTTQHTNLERN